MRIGSAKILIVDDESSVSLLLSHQLSLAGYETYTADNAFDALKLLYENSYDLLITDIKMPNMNGIELVRQLRLFNPDLPVIISSAIKDGETIKLALKIGVNDYITKPYALDELLFSVQRALDHGRILQENRRYQHRLEEMIRQQREKLNNLFTGTISSLIKAQEARFHGTAGHSARVADIAVRIGRAIGCKDEALRKLHTAGLLHDIGMIGVQDSIIQKPAALTEQEIAIIQSHPVAGVDILSPIFDDESLLRAIRHHHESYDGSGYPDGLKEIEIPLGARILIIAESYDSMTSFRPYRDTLKPEQAVEIIKSLRGVKYDPDLVDAFVQSLEEAEAEKSMTLEYSDVVVEVVESEAIN